MSQQAANVVDFTAYRARRDRDSSPPVPTAHNTLPYMPPGSALFAMPVLMPAMVAWLPFWGVVVFPAGTGDA